MVFGNSSLMSGANALRHLNDALRAVRNDAVRLDHELSRVANAVSDAQQQRLKLLSSVAKERLQALDSGDLLSNLSSADIEVSQLLEQRQLAQQQIQHDVEQTNSGIARSEDERQALFEAVNQSSQRVDEIESKVQQLLDSDHGYRQALSAAQQLENQAETAKQKAQDSQASLSEKARPYQQDDLFMYLWNRGYGTTDYRANPFSRMMDSWVARLIKFEPARQNYWNLCEIPKRLTDHATAMQQELEASLLDLQELEFEALKDNGIDEAEAALEHDRKNLDEHDDQIEQLEQQLNELLAQRAQYLSGDDSLMQQSIKRLQRALEHKDMWQLQQYVEQTPSKVDDGLLSELSHLDNALDGYQRELAQVRKLHDSKAAQLLQIEDVRRQFKNARYDDVRSGFSNENLVSGAISQFIQGLVSGSELWDILARNQRYRQRQTVPSYGSDGMGGLNDFLGEVMESAAREAIRFPRRRRSRPTWHRPKPRSRGGRINFPHGRGGFRFPKRGGGGGFKTGGGF